MVNALCFLKVRAWGRNLHWGPIAGISLNAEHWWWGIFRSLPKGRLDGASPLCPGGPIVLEPQIPKEGRGQPASGNGNCQRQDAVD